MKNFWLMLLSIICLYFGSVIWGEFHDELVGLVFLVLAAFGAFLAGGIAARADNNE